MNRDQFDLSERSSYETKDSMEAARPKGAAIPCFVPNSDGGQDNLTQLDPRCHDAVNSATFK